MRQRPVFLNLFKIHLPLPGFVSILHRISGVFNILVFPLLIYLYALLPQGVEAEKLLNFFWVKLMLWATMTAFVYHFFAGLRHMYFDFTHIHHLSTARRLAWCVLVVSVLSSLWIGVRIWFI